MQLRGYSQMRAALCVSAAGAAPKMNLASLTRKVSVPTCKCPGIGGEVTLHSQNCRRAKCQSQRATTIATHHWLSDSGVGLHAEKPSTCNSPARSFAARGSRGQRAKNYELKVASAAASVSSRSATMTRRGVSPSARHTIYQSLVALQSFSHSDVKRFTHRPSASCGRVALGAPGGIAEA
eukprot:4846330-Pleurochrysis_carterae.AAC.1